MAIATLIHMIGCGEKAKQKGNEAGIVDENSQDLQEGSGTGTGTDVEQRTDTDIAGNCTFYTD